MNKYQNSAALFTRIMGFTILTISFLSFLYAMIFLYVLNQSMPNIESWPNTFFYMVLGSLLCAFSRRIGYFLGKNLEDK